MMRRKSRLIYEETLQTEASKPRLVLFLFSDLLAFFENGYCKQITQY